MWASDEVIARIGDQVQPEVGLPRRMAAAATATVVFTWLPTFLVFAATTLAAPSVTNGAGVGTTAFWAVQVAVLLALAAMVGTLWRRDTGPDPAERVPPIGRALLRVAVHTLRTGACAGLVLAVQGLSVGQIATLTVALVVVLHLLPLVVARALHARRRGAASATD
ncbi:hypothetical protein AWW66_09205 [Micromonospora rosaria]|uniref:Uncharacterized protein n=1 Tax=Micromonospora rosaria TaxID=47874 RepID=A0A136PVJ0_9ACTN|nr:hypothetical protein AWW66_09205 [Micromonospora rosaria]